MIFNCQKFVIFVLGAWNQISLQSDDEAKTVILKIVFEIEFDEIKYRNSQVF